VPNKNLVSKKVSVLSC